MIPIPPLLVREHGVYQNLQGFRFHHATGRVECALAPRQGLTGLIAEEDILEACERNIVIGEFSLNQVDFRTHHHPFQHVFFVPTSLQGTHYLHNLLVTDMLLKFFTTGVETRAVYPFDARSTEFLLERLPSHLKCIIEDFQAHPGTSARSAHRFWIVADTVPVLRTHYAEWEQFAFGPVNMLVKTHKMRMNASGEFQDDPHERKGMRVYTCHNKEEIPHTPDRALVCLRTSKHCALILEGRVISPWYRASDCIPPKLWSDIFALEYTESGCIQTESDTCYTEYQLLCAFSKATGIPHEWSPEQVFAAEFSLHYDEFSEYFPQFARLKEQAKLQALVQQLNANAQHCAAMQSRIKEWLPDAWKKDLRGFLRAFHIPQQAIEAQMSQTKKILDDLRQDITREIYAHIEKECSARTIRTGEKWVWKGWFTWEKEPQFTTIYPGLFRARPSEAQIAEAIATNITTNLQHMASSISCPFPTLLSASKGDPAALELASIFSIAHNLAPALVRDQKKLEGIQKNLASIGITGEMPQSDDPHDLKFRWNWVPSALNILKPGRTVYGGVQMVPKVTLYTQTDPESHFIPNVFEEKYETFELKRPKDTPLRHVQQKSTIPQASAAGKGTGEDSSSSDEDFFGALRPTERKTERKTEKKTAIVPKSYEEKEKKNDYPADAKEAKTKLYGKLTVLQEIEKEAETIKQLPDGRMRFYEKEIPSSTPGPTRGRAFVKEYNPKTGEVRTWMECYNHKGEVNRIHIKHLYGNEIEWQHYPATGIELDKAAKGELIAYFEERRRQKGKPK